MKKLIIIFLILGILIMGCSKNQDYIPQSSPSPSPAVGGGCQVIENENQETEVRYIRVEVGL